MFCLRTARKERQFLPVLKNGVSLPKTNEELERGEFTTLAKVGKAIGERKKKK